MASVGSQVVQQLPMPWHQGVMASFNPRHSSPCPAWSDGTRRGCHFANRPYRTRTSKRGKSRRDSKQSQDMYPVCCFQAPEDMGSISRLGNDVTIVKSFGSNLKFVLITVLPRLSLQSAVSPSDILSLSAKNIICSNGLSLLCSEAGTPNIDAISWFEHLKEMSIANCQQVPTGANSPTLYYTFVVLKLMAQ